MPWVPGRSEPYPPEPDIHFSVSYFPDGETDGMKDIDIVSGSRYVIKSDAAVGMNCLDQGFAGWNTRADGSGTAYMPGEVIAVIDNLTLFAQWTARPSASLGVTYHPNGGTGGAADTGVIPGSQYVVKDAAAVGLNRRGHAFTGWNTVPDGSRAAYALGQTILPTRDLTLYAQWIRNQG